MVGGVLVTGPGDTNVNAPGKVALRPPTDTTTSATPAARGAVVAVSEVGPVRVTLVAATPPSVTEMPVTKLEPVIVMAVPPIELPLVGVMEETASVEPGWLGFSPQPARASRLTRAHEARAWLRCTRSILRGAARSLPLAAGVAQLYSRLTAAGRRRRPMSNEPDVNVGVHVPSQTLETNATFSLSRPRRLPTSNVQ